MPRLSVVSPVYNAAGCLDELHRRLTSVLTAMGVSSTTAAPTDRSRRSSVSSRPIRRSPA
jgi:hypothetical protein